MFDKLEDLLIRYEEIMSELGEPGCADDQNRFKRLMKEQSDLAPIVEAYGQYKKSKKDIEDSLEMAQGAYFVRIVGEQVNAIRKLIVR